MLKRVRDLAGRARVRAQCPVNIRAFPASRIFRRARHAGSGSVIPCEVARDLIPLYADGAASEETRSLVGAHLAECKSCADYYRFVKMAAKKTPYGRSVRQARGRRIRRDSGKDKAQARDLHRGGGAGSGAVFRIQHVYFIKPGRRII